MAKFSFNSKIMFEVYIALTEEEARALDALAGYGVDDFIQQFYSHLGKAYMEPHENGLRSLLASIRKTIPSQLSAVDNARRALEAAKRGER